MSPTIDAEENNIENDSEEEAPAADSNGVSIPPKRTVIKLRIKVQEREVRSEEAGNNMASSSSSTSDDSENYESSEVGYDQRSRRNICAECKKEFPSAKSLYGHLRSHPNKGYKGATPPSILPKRAAGDSDDQISGWPARAKRARSRYDAKEANTEETEAAMALKMLSIGLQQPAAHVINEIQDRKANHHRDQTRNGVVKKCYKCNICNRSFSTHQALGGHKASHNKNKHNLEVETSPDGREENGSTHRVDPNETIQNAVTAKSTVSVSSLHQCELCGKTFGSGQALGGHKREHYGKTTSTRRPSTGSSASAAPLEIDAKSTKHVLNDFDLNKPPRSDAEEPSKSDAEEI